MRKVTAIGAVMFGLVLVLSLAAPAFADPPGNNGTVKIESLDLDSIPENEPHQGCIFNIEFRGYDEGDLNATVTLAAQPPSGDVVLDTLGTQIGEDAAGGANDLDAVIQVNIGNYDLSSLFEHPQQGFHLKITVHADGSIGADTKYKVFWVEGCGGYEPSATTTGQTINAAATTPADSGPRWPLIGLAALIVGLPVLLLVRASRRFAAKAAPKGE